jgi:CRP/FNR family transcriptional regulator
MAAATAEILRSTALFRRLSPEDCERVAEVARIATYPRGTLVFAEDEPSNDFYVVISGRVKVYKMTPAGKDVILEIFGAGDPLGAVAVYEGSPFPASAMALEPVTCVAIPRGAFFDLLERYPSIVRGLLLGLTHRLVELTARLAELTGGRVEPRFARLFLKMATDVGQTRGEHTFIPMPLSRQELADMTGTTIETAIRIMSRWSKQDIVRTDKDGFTLVNREELVTLSHS